MEIKWFLLIAFIIVCNIIGALGAIWTSSDRSWYDGINKPSFTPPGGVIGSVWTLLFTLMGISLYLVWTAPSSNIKIIALTFFIIQFIFNVAWSYLFFGLNKPLWAFIEILVLFVFILITTFYFFKVNKLSGYLLIPYILWVGFASFLNYSIWKLN